MAKNRPPSTEPMFHATAGYKLWVRSAMKAKGISLAALAAKIKRYKSDANATSSSLSQFLGREDEAPTPSNTSLMPYINRALGVAPPPVCDPSSPVAQLQDRLAAVWPKLTEKQRRAIELMASGDDDA
jgi:hypothetical protein